ncbi:MULTISPECIES: hypothetical protein [Pseudomonas]|jgi:hypothetical protein|uniref:Uncharacterized protein n=1 Tax=Pseudomonas gingeri TaxID=117681 RepID=A0A7Y7WES9_9PSED|nr:MULTISPECIES: hypothetical protein [Pseudomonas]MCU1737269.1 hypothetical protein [Pseudomonas sp. 20S_6.2_Bac1]NWB48019.1 hypothetical protein [Pseudomonas gingeri]
MLLNRKYPKLHAQSVFRHPWFFPLLGALGVICWVATAASTPDQHAAGQPSAAHFLLIAQMPAQIALRANAHYIPSTNQAGCPYQPPVLHFNTPLADTPRSSDFKVPLGYELPDCKLHLSEVDFETEAFYGPDNLNRSITHGGSIAVRDNLRPGVSGFPSSGEKQYEGLCDWEITDPEALFGPGQVLTCHALDDQGRVIGGNRKPSRLGGTLSLEDLQGKRIRLNLKMKEQP